MKFKVWVNGQLMDAQLEPFRGHRGRFLPTHFGYAFGKLDDGRKGEIRQDDQAKLYFVESYQD